MDIAAIKKAKDEELWEVGLVHRGDMLALRAFVKKGLSSETAEKKQSLLQSLTDKFSANRTGKNAKKKKSKFFTYQYHGERTFEEVSGNNEESICWLIAGKNATCH